MKKNIRKLSIRIKVNDKPRPDFVAIDDKRERICICGHRDEFRATYIDGRWRIGYPEFDDLMDNYVELKDKERAEKYSNDARNAVKSLLSKLT